MDYDLIRGRGRGSRNTPSYATASGITANLKGHLAHMPTLLPLQSCFLPWPPFRTNAHRKHLTWKWISFQGNELTGHVLFHTFCHRGKSQLFIHELLTEPLIFSYPILIRNGIPRTFKVSSVRCIIYLYANLSIIMSEYMYINLSESFWKTTCSPFTLMEMTMFPLLTAEHVYVFLSNSNEDVTNAIDVKYPTNINGKPTVDALLASGFTKLPHKEAQGTRIICSVPRTLPPGNIFQLVLPGMHTLSTRYLYSASFNIFQIDSIWQPVCTLIMSWRGQNVLRTKKYATNYISISCKIFLPLFDVLRAVSQYISTDKWNLFVLGIVFFHFILLTT